MSTNGFREMLREVRDYERRMGFGEPTTLTEGKPDDHVGIVDGKIVVNRTRAEEQALEEALAEIHEARLPAPPPAVPAPAPTVVREIIREMRSFAPVLIGDDGREIPGDIHARLACAIDGTRLFGAKPLADARALDEAKKRVAPVTIPEDTHRRLAEAMGDAPLVPEGIHERLARAVCL